MRLQWKAVVALFVAGTPCRAVHVSAAANYAFEQYSTAQERRLSQQRSSPETYIAAIQGAPSDRANAERELRSGAIRVQPINGGSWQVSGGWLHHWRASAFVAGATRGSMLSLLKDYNHLSTYYPEVVSSRALKENGGVTTLAMRLKKLAVLTVVFDAEYLVQTGLTGKDGGFESSRSTHVWQVEAPGTAREHRLTEGDDDGLLWRINAYWSFLEAKDGLFIECEAVSLTRDVPNGLSWLVLPIIRDLPRTSLESTLTATKEALALRKEQAR